MAIRTSLEKIPYDHQRVIFSYLQMDELNATAQTCKNMLKKIMKKISVDEEGLRKYARKLNKENQLKNLFRYIPAIPTIELRPGEPVLKQLKDYHFTQALEERLSQVPARTWQRAGRVTSRVLAIASVITYGLAATSSAPLHARALVMVANPTAPLLYHNRPLHVNPRIFLMILGALEAGISFGRVISGCNVRDEIALYGTGVLTIIQGFHPSIIPYIVHQIDTKCTRAYVKYSAHAERARRRKYYARAERAIDRPSCCLKVTSTIGAIKRYAAATLFELIRPVARMVTPPL